jgi:hypothetical protein
MGKADVCQGANAASTHLIFGVCMAYKNSKWNEEEMELLRSVYAKATPHELEKMFGRRNSTISLKANYMGIKKDPEYLSKIRNRSPEAEVKERIEQLDDGSTKRHIKSGLLTIKGNVLVHKGF